MTADVSSRSLFSIRGGYDLQSDFEVRSVELCDLEDECLESFDRYQTTRRTKVMNPDGDFVYADNAFIDDWDLKRKCEVVAELRSCLRSGGFVAGAFLKGSLVGFASVENSFFGSDNQYLEMPLIHVTKDLRGNGIGRRLFALCCDDAAKRGAGKLYISAHPSLETQAFYDSLGCVPACEINEEIYAREPYDIQLEFNLDR